MKRILLVAQALLSVTWGLLSAGSCVIAGDTIRLGFVADATGVGESWYKSQKAGIDLFIEETNASGGVLGKKLELIVRDSALKPDLGAAAAEELIVKEKCDFLIGPTSSGVALPVSRVASKYKKIVMFHTSNTEDLTTRDFQPYMFMVVPNTGIESRGLGFILSAEELQAILLSWAGLQLRQELVDELQVVPCQAKAGCGDPI